MNFIGIDLAWSTKNPSGFCIMNASKEVTFLAASNYSNEALIQLIVSSQPAMVSVDAPLVVTNETGGRTCDSLLMKTPIHGKHLKVYATSTKYMLSTFGTIRGQDIYKELEEVHGFSLGNQIVETFPTGIFLSLFPDLYDMKYKISSRLPLSELLYNANQVLKAIEKLGFTFPDFDLQSLTTKASYKPYEDKIDALLCSLNSWYTYHNQAIIFSTDENGYTTLPKPR